MSRDDDVMLKGIKQILGKEEYDPPEVVKECNHVSDGYIYEVTPLYVTLRCEKCGIHYDIPNNNGIKV